MKQSKIFLLLVCCAFVSTAYAQELESIPLNAPDMNRGTTIMKAFQQRKSDRVYAKKDLSVADLSDLLWAANGINRPESGKRTAPSSMNIQDIEIYVCRADGAYLYNPKKQELTPVNKGDFRSAVGGQQDFVEKAPVSLVLVSSKGGMTGAYDAGIVSQNISIFCAGAGLATVPRVSMDQNKLKTALKLTEGQHLMMNHPVGYPLR